MEKPVRRSLEYKLKNTWMRTMATRVERNMKHYNDRGRIGATGRRDTSGQRRGETVEEEGVPKKMTKGKKLCPATMAVQAKTALADRGLK